jgi:hypothetical protein
MKKTLLLILAFAATTLAFAAKIYVNPGHGGWGSNDRPMGTISYPPLSSTGRPDTLGFYESNTNMWKAYYLREKLQAAGHTVVMSHTKCGTSPALTTIAAEAQHSGADYFISIHSNALSEGATTNYPSLWFRGKTGNDYAKGSLNMTKTMWPLLFDIHQQGMEYNSTWSLEKPGIYADISQWGSSSTSYIDGVGYTGYYGVLKHGIPGYISEGYFHTYQPARHRALNPDWCCQEGLRYFRGIQAYFGKAGESKGYIMGYVRTKDKEINQTYYTGRKGNDIYMPINGAKVYLTNANGDTIMTNCYNYVARMLKNQKCYTTDNNYNGVFVYENLAPGTYTLTVRANGYKKYTQSIIVTADKTSYAQVFLTTGTDDDDNTDPTPTPGGDTNAANLNPFAYGLTAELNADSTQVTLLWWLNAPAATVKIIFNDGEKDYVVRDYKNVPVDGYKDVIQTSVLPRGKQLTWRVDVTGAAVTQPTFVNNSVKLYSPTSIDIDNNPENDNFGSVFVVEAMPNAKDNSNYSSYISYVDGAGLYVLNPDGKARRMPNQGDKIRYGYNGGRVQQTRPYFNGTASGGYSPYRVRVSDDGRIFVSSMSTDGQVLWEADPYVFSHPNAADWQDRAVVGWSHVMSVKNENTFMATEKRNCSHTYCGIYSLYEGNAETGKFIAGPNIGFDVQGSGKDLKLLMLSGCKEAIVNFTSHHFYCSEYDLGEAKKWTTVPSREIFRGHVVNYAGSQVQYDQDGNVWLCQHRSGTDAATLMKFNAADGSTAFNEDPKQPYHRCGAIRFNNDYTQVAIASVGSGTGGAFTVYPVVDGMPVWNQGTEVDCKSVTHHSLMDFAWDYAGNLYIAADAASGNAGKCVAVYAMPHAADRVVSTPAAEKYTFTLSKRSYTVSATANDPSMGSVAGAGTYEEGATATLTATAAEGYEFVNWTVNDEVLTDNPITLTVNSDITAVATFKAIEVVVPTYTVTVTANDTTMGAVTGAGTYAEGTIATLTATPNEGYEFVNWIVDDEVLTDNPLNLIVTSDINIVATFKTYVSTDLENTDHETEQIEKILRENRVYIRVNDQLYTITGARVEQ